MWLNSTLPMIKTRPLRGWLLAVWSMFYERILGEEKWVNEGVEKREFSIFK